MEEVKIIKRFCKEYNYHDLDLEKIRKYSDELIKLSEEIIKESEKTPIPVFILLNHYKPKYKKYDYLSDSASFYYLTSKKYDKKIYLFGDIHNNEGICSSDYKNTVTSDIFIEKIIKNSDVFIDFFIEIIPIIEPKKFFAVDETKKYNQFEIMKKIEKGAQLIQEDAIDRIRHNFLKCYMSIKNCEYPNLRAHAFDIRFLSGFFLDFYNEINGKYLLLNDKFRNIQDVENYKKELKKNILSSDKIMKQLNMIEEKEIKEKIINFIFSKIDSAQISNDFIVKTLNNIADIYLLGRMFKTFNTKNNFHPNKSRNIILYAGDAHTQNIKNFLVNELGFEIKETFVDVDKQCINISNLKIPYFR